MLDPKHLLIDGKSSADAPQPWKMGLMGKRLVFCEEPIRRAPSSILPCSKAFVAERP